MVSSAYAFRSGGSSFDARGDDTRIQASYLYRRRRIRVVTNESTMRRLSELSVALVGSPAPVSRPMLILVSSMSRYVT